MDNTLLDDHDPPRIKLCDFGFARNWMGEPEMTTITGTPDYMSPQLLGAKLGLGGPSSKPLYDGTKADIWAAGVMLCVMLIGRFPFEGIEMHNVHNLEDVSAHVWQMQTQATDKWHANPLIAHDCGMLSPDCIDLLDRMFELEEPKRITVAGIKRHPWFNRQLPSQYGGALEQLAREQKAIDQQVATGAFVCRDRDSALKAMVYHAASPYNPDAEGTFTMGGAEGQDGGGDRAGAVRKISLMTQTASARNGAGYLLASQGSRPLGTNSVGAAQAAARAAGVAAAEQEIAAVMGGAAAGGGGGEEEEQARLVPLGAGQASEDGNGWWPAADPETAARAAAAVAAAPAGVVLSAGRAGRQAQELYAH
ncbi:hypothetical protein MNEG_0325 [Monoraphidium neglectum]|uniref:Protein kinase domain-containing protein n=1 Tax=Monoraphidium neglectum TaxID=145388 RepID=A0A0D2LMY7_9CHLO|nr:hypothetical protein MNEG_0325 [Monoraphidium neglectum]KIZ07629.1 hypothetical protein MNEG_0325 [Monoraphidium neglectum]|eukprot:XP_013906648.1 hypothetical protein MNEG_0325 [Monoraphidium neglectum]